MKEQSRTQRMIALNKHRKDKGASLNMVSLMDIFTILVFFLLVTSSDSESLPSAKSIKLPSSTTEQQPKKTLVVMVNEKDIQINGKHIVTVADAINSDKKIIPRLALELIEHAKTQPVNKKRYDITVMGDKEIPYKLLKKIMLTCAGTKFANISLAVVRKQVEKG